MTKNNSKLFKIAKDLRKIINIYRTKNYWQSGCHAVMYPEGVITFTDFENKKSKFSIAYGYVEITYCFHHPSIEIRQSLENSLTFDINIWLKNVKNILKK